MLAFRAFQRRPKSTKIRTFSKPHDALTETPQFEKARKTTLVPIEWQHSADKKKIPLELLEFQKGNSPGECLLNSLTGVKKEMQAKEQLALRIMKTPDYQYYDRVLTRRIEKVEQMFIWWRPL